MTKISILKETEDLSATEIKPEVTRESSIQETTQKCTAEETNLMCTTKDANQACTAEETNRACTTESAEKTTQDSADEFIKRPKQMAAGLPAAALPPEEQARHEKYMKEALRQARKALALDEVPIGCVIVREDRIIARGYNRRNTDKNTLSHAELNAIRKASRVVGDWRLEGCTMYVTLEPCQMCAGALVQSRIDHVVIGCMNPKAGCAGSVLNILQMEGFNHKVQITKGILESTCSAMLSDFFRSLRERKKKQ